MSKPVIYVPGYPGSHLWIRGGKKIFLSLPAMLPKPKEKLLEMLEGPDDLTTDDGIVAGLPIERLADLLLFDLAKQAGSLYDILEKIGIDPVKFGWDWRRPVWDSGTQSRLEGEIRALHLASGRPVVLIVHSTGGLLLRYLLEQVPTLVPLVERVIAFGVPWAGLLKSLRFLDGREKFVTVTKKKTQDLIARSWAAFDLLPPDPATTDMRDARGNPLNLVVDGSGRQTSPLVKQGWFRGDLASRMGPRADAADRELGGRTAALRLGGRSLEVTNVVGWGAETVVQATISGSGSQQTISGWREVSEAPGLDGGDGTVPFRSASWLQGDLVTRYHLPVGFHSGAKKNPHSSLWRNPGGRNLLHHLLGGKSLKPFVYAAVDMKDFGRKSTANVRVRLSTLDAQGQPLAGVRVRAVDLAAGPAIDLSLPPGDGRHLVTIPRRRMRHVHGNRFRRFTLRIDWNGGGLKRVLIVDEQGG